MCINCNHCVRCGNNGGGCARRNRCGCNCGCRANTGCGTVCGIGCGTSTSCGTSTGCGTSTSCGTGCCCACSNRRIFREGFEAGYNAGFRDGRNSCSWGCSGVMPLYEAEPAGGCGVCATETSTVRDDNTCNC